MNSKVPQKYAMSDWYTSNKLLQTNAERLRNSSHIIRQEGRRLINETDNFTGWTQHETNCKLANRIENVNEWKTYLEKYLGDIDKEIEALQLSKQNTELSLETAKRFLDTTIECLVLRENREGIDCVRDTVEEELHKEVEILGSIKTLLQQKLNDCFEQLCLSQEARHELSIDLFDKNHALDIDSYCHQLSNGSYTQLNSRVSSEHAPAIKEMVTLEVWHSFSENNKAHVETAIKTSQVMRKHIYATLEKIKTDLESKKKTTEYAFRKRIHEIEQSKDELEWQRQNTIDEIQALEKDIEMIKNAIEAKIAPLQVAETRVECRSLRRNVELCRDNPYTQISRELGELHGTVEALLEKRQITEVAVRRLLKDLTRIEKDLEIKSKSLQLDKQCLEIRESMFANLDSVTQSVVSIGDKANDPHFHDTQLHVLKQKSLPLTSSETQNLKKDLNQNESTLRSTYDCDFNRFVMKRSNDLQRTINIKESLYA